MSCAPSPSSDFLSLSRSPPFLFSFFFFALSHNSSDGNHCESYPRKNPFHQEQTDCIIYRFSYLCTLWLLALFSGLFAPVYVLSSASPPARRRLDNRRSFYSIDGCIFFFFFLLPARWSSTLLFRTLDAISCCLESQLSIISIVAGKPQSALVWLLIFFLLVTLKRRATQKEQKLQDACVCDWCAPFLNEISRRLTGKRLRFRAKRQNVTSHTLCVIFVRFCFVPLYFKCLLRSDRNSFLSGAYVAPMGKRKNRKSSITLLPLWFYRLLGFFFTCCKTQRVCSLLSSTRTL